MKDILWLIRKTLRNTFRAKSSWFVYFGLPLVGILISTLLYGSSNGNALRVGIVNNDGNQVITQDAIKFIEGLNQVKITMTDEKSLRSDIASSKLDSGLIFNQGFADSVRQGSPGAAQVDILSVKGAQVTAYVKAMLQSYVSNVAAIGRSTKGDSAAFDKLYAEYSAQNFKLHAETIEDTSNRKDMTYQTIGLLVTFMMFSAVNLSELILKEKESRTFLRLMTSPISARTYVLSNVIVNLLIMLLQIAFTLFMMKTVFHIDSGVPYSQLIPVLLLFALAAIGLSLLMVAFAKSTAGAGALQNLIITPTCMLSGCFFPMEIMPDSIRKISNFLPQHWLLDSINKLQQGDAFGSLGLNLAILFGFAAVFSLIAVYRFSRNNDTRMFV
ncbi:ABC transporter permease [Cohnella cholangitidis]|uniref:Transport permease protein n=1 Tax=Cohnella cholangitidis TaxID=2598458 RepID=A0A7G5C016_9BACL|nr:ABC transporter permease [Cohnella cholangitidis]QMV42550.1 ABC transporter permease [Cohnella cholangitidis]